VGGEIGRHTSNISVSTLLYRVVTGTTGNRYPELAVRKGHVGSTPTPHTRYCDTSRQGEVLLRASLLAHFEERDTSS
jgi:hypothetical protein